MTEETKSIMTPVGRLVSGSVDDAQTVTDPTTRQPKVDAQGNQHVEYYIGVAIPKGNEGHWANTEWGAVLWQVGHTSFPGGQAQSRPDFAWKVTDGDSQVPNQNNVRPCDREGYAGNWILSFKTGFAPQMVNADGSQAIAGSEFYRGCYVQVLSSVRGNGSQQSPGIYLNHQIVALSGHGERISTGPDAATAGFGQAALPQGASQTPVAQNVAANVPGAPQPTQAAATAPPQPAAAPTVAQQPAGAPPAPGAPAAPPVGAPAAPHPQVMTPPQVNT